VVKWAPSPVHNIVSTPIFKVGSTNGDFATGAYWCSNANLGLDGVVVDVGFNVLPMKLMIMVLKSAKTTTLFVVERKTLNTFPSNCICFSSINV
jgi:hypothetical protein